MPRAYKLRRLETTKMRGSEQAGIRSGPPPGIRREPDTSTARGINWTIVLPLESVEFCGTSRIRRSSGAPLATIGPAVHPAAEAASPSTAPPRHSRTARSMPTVEETEEASGAPSQHPRFLPDARPGKISCLRRETPVAMVADSIDIGISLQHSWSA